MKYRKREKKERTADKIYRRETILELSPDMNENETLRTIGEVVRADIERLIDLVETQETFLEENKKKSREEISELAKRKFREKIRNFGDSGREYRDFTIEVTLKTDPRYVESLGQESYIECETFLQGKCLKQKHILPYYCRVGGSEAEKYCRNYRPLDRNVLHKLLQINVSSTPKPKK
jgi:hypothetical protein